MSNPTHNPADIGAFIVEVDIEVEDDFINRVEVLGWAEAFDEAFDEHLDARAEGLWR